ncbi:MAG: hypothetical protein WB806_22715 [Xanthobacteraceae bacterium]
MKMKIIVAIAAMLAASVSSASAQALVTGTGSNSASATSWVGGAHAGYNWQNNSWVYGTSISPQPPPISGSSVTSC